MALSNLEIAGYRSLRKLELPLSQLNVITGPNGSGKSSLYRALWLVAQVCEGEFARSIAREGGLLSAMWAGPRTDAKHGLRMSLGFCLKEFHYQLSCGFPQPIRSMFCFDPYIKEEAVWHGTKRKPSTTFLERAGGMTRIRDAEENFVEYPLVLGENESVLSQLREPHRFPELFMLRDEVRHWRFYHHFRTDDEAPLRAPRTSVRTPILSHDGSDLAAALQTILEVGDGDTLLKTISDALPGRSLRILQNDNDPKNKSPAYTELAVGLETGGCTRILLARELSDGTLKFLCLAAALLSPRPPALIALNEPEGSLHPDLLKPLARLIVDAANFSQIWVSTHSTMLASAIRDMSGVRPVELELRGGETVVREE